MKEDTTFDEMVYTILGATDNGNCDYGTFAKEMKTFGFTSEDLEKARLCDAEIEKEIQHQRNLNLVRAIAEASRDSEDDAA